VLDVEGEKIYLSGLQALQAIILALVGAGAMLVFLKVLKGGAANLPAILLLGRI
jgi:hypothetical protein